MKITVELTPAELIELRDAAMDIQEMLRDVANIQAAGPEALDDDCIVRWTDGDTGEEQTTVYPNNSGPYFEQAAHAILEGCKDAPSYDPALAAQGIMIPSPEFTEAQKVGLMAVLLSDSKEVDTVWHALSEDARGDIHMGVDALRSGRHLTFKQAKAVLALVDHVDLYAERWGTAKTHEDPEAGIYAAISELYTFVQEVEEKQDQKAAPVPAPVVAPGPLTLSAEEAPQMVVSKKDARAFLAVVDSPRQEAIAARCFDMDHNYYLSDPCSIYVLRDILDSDRTLTLSQARALAAFVEQDDLAGLRLQNVEVYAAVSRLATFIDGNS